MKPSRTSYGCLISSRLISSRLVSSNVPTGDSPSRDPRPRSRFGFQPPPLPPPKHHRDFDFSFSNASPPLSYWLTQLCTSLLATRPASDNNNDDDDDDNNDDDDDDDHRHHVGGDVRDLSDDELGLGLGLGLDVRDLSDDDLSGFTFRRECAFPWWWSWWWWWWWSSSPWVWARVHRRGRLFPGVAVDRRRLGKTCKEIFRLPLSLVMAFMACTSPARHATLTRCTRHSSPAVVTVVVTPPPLPPSSSSSSPS